MMHKDERKLLISNSIKFVIGSILLAFSFVYLHNHPAEKETVLSGFKMVGQKIQIFIQKRIGNDGELLEKKYTMEKYYKELISLADNKKCIEADIVSQLHENYDKLQGETIATLKDSLSDYTSLIYRIDPIVRADCPTE